MAKQLKVFQGSTSFSSSSSTTIYTVPSGRVAKVTLAYVRLAAAHAGNEAIGINIGDYICQTAHIDGQANQLRLVFPDNQLAGGTALMGTKIYNGLSSGAGTVKVIPQYYYLTASQSIVIYNNSPSSSQTSARYSISVVEEY